MILACACSCVVGPSLAYFSKAIINETLKEAKLCYVERDSYRQLFNALQEGVLVIQDSKIIFMNELAN